MYPPILTMCKVTHKESRPPLRLLVSLDSFAPTGYGETPCLRSCTLTGVVVLIGLTLSELLFRYFFQSIAHLHPSLQPTEHQQILARHVGVDALSCAIMAILGWNSRHVNMAVFQASLFGKKGEMPKAGHDQRLFTYHPGGFRIALFFFIYQIKNLHDSFVWNDGPEFLFHHVFSLVTAWGAMVPGCGHFYTIFFFGICEISTGVLCLLANFDDEQGVPGLGDALPMVKVVLGAIFVTLFIIFRCILWPIHSYYFSRDVLLALSGTDPRAVQRRGWLKFFLVSLTGLSILQVAWLGQIFVIAKEELTKIGLIG